MLKSKSHSNDMSGIAITLCVGIALYIGVNLFFAEKPVYTTQTITVHSGDTLWSIAGKFRHESEDIRDVIDRIYDANGLTKAYIYPGQVLKVPVRE